MTDEFVILQAGHENIGENEIARLRSGTGAPDEITFTKSLVDRAAFRLRENHQVNAVHVDANRHSIYDQEAELFVALHYDSFIPNKDRGCRFARGTFDFAAPKSDTAVAIFKDIWPRVTGIPLYRNNQASVNMTAYYGFGYCRANTPAIIAECGVGHHPQDRPLLCNPDGTASELSVTALTTCITAYLGSDPMPAPDSDIVLLQAQVQAANERADFERSKFLKWQASTERLIQISHDTVNELLAKSPHLARERQDIEEQYAARIKPDYDWSQELDG
tara:strand:- start:466 stop:1293 length:828 start_codon:yes stop_codon:yes gene_type:complete